MIRLYASFTTYSIETHESSVPSPALEEAGLGYVSLGIKPASPYDRTEVE